MASTGLRTRGDSEDPGRGGRLAGGGQRENCRTGIELEDAAAPDRRYPHYGPITSLPETGRQWWSEHQNG
ncbi:hypothetical protein [Crossiella sp. CA198]|uniref:hypothetical protein n=1 Tax=Crossiella sp. CA198 TaxID=3455607 RepID=UPI003F8D1971